MMLDQKHSRQPLRWRFLQICNDVVSQASDYDSTLSSEYWEAPHKAVLSRLHSRQLLLQALSLVLSSQSGYIIPGNQQCPSNDTRIPGSLQMHWGHIPNLTIEVATLSGALRKNLLMHTNYDEYAQPMNSHSFHLLFSSWMKRIHGICHFEIYSSPGSPEMSSC